MSQCMSKALLILLQKNHTKNSMEQIKIYFIEREGQFLVKTTSNVWTSNPLKAKKFLKPGIAQAQASSVYKLYPEFGPPSVTECIINFSERVETPGSSFKCINNRIKSLKESLERELRMTHPYPGRINELETLIEVEERKLQEMQRYGN